MNIIGHAQMKAVTSVARIPVFLPIDGDKRKDLEKVRLYVFTASGHTFTRQISGTTSPERMRKEAYLQWGERSK
jgi:hypothetical protein